jgi:hypothetical protein
MIHSRVADDAHLKYLLCGNSRCVTKFRRQPVYAVYYHFVQLQQFFVGLSISDSADYIVAVSNLRIDGCLCRSTLAGRHINQFRNNCRSADINGYAEYFFFCVGVFKTAERLDFFQNINAVLENFMLKESGFRRYGYREVSLNMVLAG